MTFNNEVVSLLNFFGLKKSTLILSFFAILRILIESVETCITLNNLLFLQSLPYN